MLPDWSRTLEHGCRTLNQSDAKLNQLLFGYFCSLGILSFSSLNLWRSSSGLISHCDKSSFNLRYLIEKRFLRKCLPLFDNKCWYCNANFLFGLVSFLFSCSVEYIFDLYAAYRNAIAQDRTLILFSLDLTAKFSLCCRQARISFTHQLKQSSNWKVYLIC